MNTISFELIPFSINPEVEGYYIVKYEDGHFETLQYIEMYGSLEWRDSFDNLLIIEKPIFWLKEVK